MPRANRYWVNGAAYHLTHRCHDRSFLFSAREDRNAYIRLLRFHLLDSGSVSLLNYTITSNHIHLLVTSESAEKVAELMRKVQGEHAAWYNRVHGRSGAFWSDRDHATMIDSGEHLLACMKYIDLNMVRAGAVSHPKEWQWTGWHELVGKKKRYRIIDQKALLQRLLMFNAETFRAYYQEAIDLVLHLPEENKRDGSWTESLAVGSIPFIQQAEAVLVSDDKRRFMNRDIHSSGSWILRETKPAFSYSSEESPVAGL